MNKFIQILIAILIIHQHSANSQTFHLLLVADTEDKSIGRGCVVDQTLVIDQVSAICQEIKYKMDTIVINRNYFSYQSVKDAIERFKCAPSDIVLFYYSGHGYNLDDVERKSDWPLMHLKTKGMMYGLDEVHQDLKKKGARLLITLGDLCNEIINRRLIAPKGLIIEDVVPTNKLNIYSNLFSEYKGDILISTSKRGQYSYSDPANGSFYTICFTEAINNAANYNSTIDWKNLLNDSESRLNKMLNDFSVQQTPQYSININIKKDSVTVKDKPKKEIPAPLPTPTISFDEINKYLNSIADQNIKKETRLASTKQYSKYFVQQAKVRIYVNKTFTDLMPVEDFLTEILLNANKIDHINFIENKSKFNFNTKKYEEIAIQEIWINR